MKIRADVDAFLEAAPAPVRAELVLVWEQLQADPSIGGRHADYARRTRLLEAARGKGFADAPEFARPRQRPRTGPPRL